MRVGKSCHGCGGEERALARSTRDGDSAAERSGLGWRGSREEGGVDQSREMCLGGIGEEMTTGDSENNKGIRPYGSTGAVLRKKKKTALKVFWVTGQRQSIRIKSKIKLTNLSLRSE